MNTTTTAPAGKADAKGTPAANPAGAAKDGEAKTAAAAKTDAKDGENEAKASTGGGKDIVPSKYRDQYAANKGTCGDFIASELSAVMEGGVAMLKGVKKANGIAEAAWAGLNNGQQRMNVSNALRAAYLRGEEIDIHGKKFSLKTHMEEFDGAKGFDGSNESHVRKFLGFIDMPDNTRNMRAIKKFFHDDPTKAVERAEREAKAEQNKKDKAAAKEKAEAEKKAAAEAKAKAEAEKPKADAKGTTDKK